MARTLFFVGLVASLVCTAFTAPASVDPSSIVPTSAAFVSTVPTSSVASISSAVPTSNAAPSQVPSSAAITTDIPSSQGLPASIFPNYSGVPYTDHNELNDGQEYLNEQNNGTLSA